MRARSALTVFVGVVGSTAAALFVRGRISGKRERVELFFDDGVPVTLTQGTPEAERVLAHARELLTAARAE